MFLKNNAANRETALNKHSPVAVSDVSTQAAHTVNIIKTNVLRRHVNIHYFRQLPSF